MTSPPPSRRAGFGRAAAALLLLAGGCATLDELAPPVGLEAQHAASEAGIPLGQVERGRDVYITACARCHSPEPVRRYSSNEWASILPRMIDRCELNESDAADVRRYIEITLRAGSAPGRATPGR